MSTQYDIYPLVLNSTNVTNSDNNVLEFTFNGPQTMKGAYLALQQVSLFKSYLSISAALGNNSFSVIYPTSTVDGTLVITIPDGYYSIEQLNFLLDYSLIDAGIYLVDASGNNIYYFEIIISPTTYSVLLVAYEFPTALPAGYSNPASMTFPAVGITGQFVIPDTGIQDIFGIYAGTYPSVGSASDYTKSSDYTPQVSATQSIILSVNILQNLVSNPSTVLYSFPVSGVAYGELITSSPSQDYFVRIVDGIVPGLTLSIWDQNFRPLKLLDPNICITLLLKIPRT